MSESARFELVEGATFQLPDGSSVTVRDGQLELSDGRRLPMPAAGEAITVERTVTRPDGGTTRIKHTIRLSETEPVVQTPARPFPGAGPGSDEEDATETKETKETVSAAATAVEAVPAASEDARAAAETAETAAKVESSSAAPEPPPAALVSEAQLPEVPSKEPTAAEAGDAPVTPCEPTLMGVNCGRRSIREMLWGSIPESGFGEDEDEPKAPPKGLLNKSYSIKEEDESEHEEEETHEEALEASENADESFEFGEGKVKDAEKRKKTEAQKESEAVKEPGKDGEEDKAKESEKDEEAEKKKVPEKEETKGEEGPEKEPKPEEVSTEQVQDDSTTKPKLVTFVTSVETESSPEKADDADKEPSASIPNKPSSEDKPASPPAEPQHEKPYLTRQGHLPSSGNLVAQAGDDVVVRVGVPLLDTAPDSTPADAAPARLNSPEESTAGAATAAGPRSDEGTHDLHLKLTPILRSLESDEPKSEATGGDGKRAPSEDRKGTVPPNTPAVAEDREGLLGADEPESDPEPVCVPTVVSYYESISPRASRAPTRPPSETEASAVPKVIKFAVPMEPEKVYLGSQEPEEMEDTPIPRAAEPPARVELAPEPATLRQPTQVLIPVRGSPGDLDPLSALAASETAAQLQPSAPEEKSDDPATPSTTPEKSTAPDAAEESTAAETDGDQQKTAPHVYNPALFEPDPKRPFTSVMAEEDAPAYESSVFDARTLPIDRKESGVVTEQPPPFDEEGPTDPRDPFLPNEPRPDVDVKEFDWFTNCFDLCCCCWAP